MNPVQLTIPGTWTPHLRRAFLFIISGFVLSIGVSIYEIRHTQAEVRVIVERTLASIEWASRLSRNIDRERILFEAHIVETDPAGKERVERQLVDVENRIAAASRAYQATIADDVELASWQKLQMEIDAVRPKAKKAVELSRHNRSEEARVILTAIEPQYDAVDEQLDFLVRLNHDEADREVASIVALHRAAVIILVALTFAWTTMALFVARWVTRLISQRESEMRAATSLLAERNRELDAFAGRVAHDLRGPLTAINLAASAPRRGHDERASDVFRRAVKQMEAIIQDLLTLSRVSAQTSNAVCQVSDVAASLEEDLRPRVEAADGALYMDVAPGRVACSEGLLRQMLWNLGENAVKYRRPEGRLEVRIRGRVTSHAYEFSVSDNGPGMSPGEVQQAFEPFFRGERARDTPGTGLGLSIVKRVADASGGDVFIESVAGRGSTFRVRLPLAASKAA